MVKIIENKKPTQRTNIMMKDILKLKNIWSDTKLPNYKQLSYYIYENYDVKKITIYNYRASHDNYNSSRKVITKTTRSNEKIITIWFNNGKYKEFDSDKLYRINEAIINYIKEIGKKNE